MHVFAHHIKDQALKGAQKGPITAAAGLATGVFIGAAGVATGGAGFVLAASVLGGLGGGLLGHVTKV